MTSNINKKILATLFVAAAALATAAIASAGGLYMIIPAFAQGGKYDRRRKYY